MRVRASGKNALKRAQIKKKMMQVVLFEWCLIFFDVPFFKNNFSLPRLSLPQKKSLAIDHESSKQHKQVEKMFKCHCFW